MSAMRIIHAIENKEGKVVSFKSTTGALPSLEANNNPFGYKFSWSPRGVLLASRNAAKWLENGKEISIPGEQLFEHYYLQDVKGVGTFENYPNRNSVPYKDIYGLKDAKTVYRGTFRMTGWCETFRVYCRTRVAQRGTPQRIHWQNLWGPHETIHQCETKRKSPRSDSKVSWSYLLFCGHQTT